MKDKDVEFCLNCDQGVTPQPKTSLGAFVLRCLACFLFIPPILLLLFFGFPDFENYPDSLPEIILQYIITLFITICIVIALGIKRQYFGLVCPMCKSKNF